MFYLFCYHSVSYPLPEDFNYSNFACVPKNVNDPLVTRVSCTPDRFRMLSVSNTDHKLLAAAMAQPLGVLVSCTVVAQQRGGITGRVLGDGIIDLETHGLLCTRIASQWPALVFFDFKAAFPSIAWAFLFAVLVALGVPAEAIRFIERLYTKCTHYIRHRGMRYKVFDIRSGILQGCPMSGSLFCLALDPFLRLILSRFPYNTLWPTTMLTAYLDDMAMALAQVFSQLPLLLDLFDYFSAGAGPKLNYTKCIIIPLWTYILSAACEKLHRVIPRTRTLLVKLAAKFLGVMMGPLAHLTAWSAPFLKYCERLIRVRSFGLGFVNTLSLHNVHAFSVLSHVMQFHSYTAETNKLEREAHQRRLAAPRFIFTTAFLAHAKKCHLPYALHVLPINGKAAQYRFAVSTSNIFFQMRSTIARDYTLYCW